MTFTHRAGRPAPTDPALLRKYLVEGWTLKQFADAMGCSSRAVQRRIHRLLRDRPPHLDPPASGVLVVDATWNRRAWCLLVYRDVSGFVLACHFGLSENHEAYTRDLELLRRTGYDPAAVVSDGHPAVLKALRTVFPKATQQRCLIHVHRQALAWLTQRPKTLAGQALRDLVLRLLWVQSPAQAQEWDQALELWSRQHREALLERSYTLDPRTGETIGWWYTHRTLRKSWRLLRNARPNLWHWLLDPRIPRTSNLIEGGFNAPLKRLIRRHAGLARERQERAIQWWAYFKNKAQ